jgi:hypothetical protein
MSKSSTTGANEKELSDLRARLAQVTEENEELRRKLAEYVGK